ncbi:ABC transporter permease [Solibaculum mannosilyticum]|uniref:ABC transporter permease n=1 Tax=Solibaculum mannosilyticum TaxID=2780922 RepID=UPI0007A89ECC|nr:FtsX-like permease family protein [Eubacteriaceae bacterium CHKCI005]
MKWCSLLTDHFKQFWKRQTFLFLVLVIGVTISFFAFNSLFGTINYTTTNIAQNMYRTYSLDFDGQYHSSDQQKILDLIDQDDEVETVVFMTIDQEKPLIVGFHATSTTNLTNWYSRSEGRFFTEEELNSSKKIAVVTDDLYVPIDIRWREHPFHLDGIDYSVIGLSSDFTIPHLFTDRELQDEYYPNHNNYMNVENEDDQTNTVWSNEPGTAVIIPYKTYLEQGYSPNLVRIEYKADCYNRLPEFQKQLQDLFPQATVIPPGQLDERYYDSVKETVMQAVFVIALALVNILSLFTFWLWTNRDTFRTYRICGARQGQLFRVLAIQWGIIVLLCFGLSRLLQFALQPLAEYLNISLTLTIPQILLILIGGYLLTLLLMSRTLWQICFSKKSLVFRGWNG